MAVLFISIHAMVPYAIVFFFFNDTATTEIYTLSLHDALPIYLRRSERDEHNVALCFADQIIQNLIDPSRSEEHTSELQSLTNLVCRLLLEKKKRRLRTAVINATTINGSLSRRYHASTIDSPWP